MRHLPAAMAMCFTAGLLAVCREANVSVCKELTDYYMSIMDTKREPCKEFYEYTCGRFNSNHGTTTFAQIMTKNFEKQRSLLVGASSASVWRSASCVRLVDRLQRDGGCLSKTRATRKQSNLLLNRCKMISWACL